ncbi:MAG: T9SS type A sorting domain-containing protein [Saprospiraceae bacterium]
MKSLYNQRSFFTIFLAFTICIVGKAQTSTVYFDLDACNGLLNGPHQDYSEFTGQNNNGECANLDVQGGHLYRNNPTVNTHSCTPGVDGDVAMCIGSNPACTFTPDAEDALRLDLLVSPGSSGNSTLNELSFYEKGPTQFVWINGASGPNNYPTLFGLRILKNGTQIYLSTDIPTELLWNLNTFNFSGPEFTVTVPTIFNFEFLPYCPVGNGEPVSAWDIDELIVSFTCCIAPNGGILSGGPFEFCVGDGVPDHVTGIMLTGQTGPNSQWIVTDSQNNILDLPSSITSVDFDGGALGNYNIYHISYEDGLSGLAIGNNVLTDLTGCFDLSNSISVIRNHPLGGTLTGGPFEFCLNDTNFNVMNIDLSGNAGSHSQWVVINSVNTIISLPGSLDEIDFESFGPGTFFILNISFFDPLLGLGIGNNLINDVTGCFDLSNSIMVTLNEPNGGTLTGGPFEFCVGDSIPDYVSGVVLSGNTGTTSQWIVTNDAHIILSLPASIDSLNFDGGGQGICLIWNISYYGMISGLVPGNNLLSDVTGCFDLTNSITVVRNQPEGGFLTGGPFEFCANDSLIDVTSIIISGNLGPNSQWIVINDLGTIINLQDSLGDIDFEGSGTGTFFILNITFFDTLSGLVIGNNLQNDVSGCFDLSNPISIIIAQPDGGILTGGPFEFCVGDSISDYVSGIGLSGNVGTTSLWVITNAENEILSLPVSLDSVNFDGAPPGICLIWNISFFDTITGLIPGNNLLTDIEGCFDLSNSITVNRNHPEGGILTGGPFEFCASDSLIDVTSIILSGNVGPNSQWVVINDSNTIIILPDSLGDIDFEGFGSGTFFILNISFFDTLSGLLIGNNLNTDVTGCFDLSNSISVVINQPDGGILTGGPFEFCVGDSIPDYVSGVVLSGNVGTTSHWVITNEDNEILSLPASLDSINFDNAPPGICLIWNISYFDTISGLVPGNDLLTDITGCFDLSNQITVNRNQPAGGTLSGGPFAFCAGDSITDVTSIILSGNIGPNSQWVVTNDLNIIISLPDSLEVVDFGGNNPGVFFIWNVSFFDTLSGMLVGNDLFEDLAGCLGISDSVIVMLTQPDGGTLTGGPFEFCVGDSIADYVSGISLTGETGENAQWVITNETNDILSLPASPDSVNFDNAIPGICLIWHVSYDNGISGLEPGNNLLADVFGCFGLSNPLMVIRHQPEGGTLTGGPFEFCVGDTITDVTSIILSGNIGDNSQWVVIDTGNTILILPDSLEQVNFNGSGPGTFYIVHISYFDTLTGLIIGNNLINDVIGCLAISDSLTVTLNQPVGGELTGGPFEFCVGDTIPDHVSGVDLVGNVGANSQYVVTDSVYNILSLPVTPEDFDFNEGPPGNFLIVHISYDGLLTGLEIGNNLLTDLEGCFSLSNAITVVRIDCEGFQGGPIFELKISPNPVREIMTLEIFHSGEEMPLVLIYDASGRVCFKQYQQSDNPMKINMRNYVEGCYFVRVESIEGNKTERIIVIK